MSAVLSALGLPSVLRLREVCMVWPLSQQYSTVTCYLMLTTLVTGDRNRDFLLFWSCINLRQSLRPWVSGMWPSQCPLPNCGSQPIMPPNGSFDSISYPQVQWVFTSTLKATVIFLPSLFSFSRGERKGVEEGYRCNFLLHLQQLLFSTIPAPPEDAFSGISPVFWGNTW